MNDRLEITRLTKPPSATVRVPGSKSITNRALILAALSGKGTDCRLRGVLHSDDTSVMITALQALGIRVEHDCDGPDPVITVSSEEGEVIPVSKADIFVVNSGTTMRFLTAFLTLGHGTYRLDGVPRMRERHIGDLLHALEPT